MPILNLALQNNLFKRTYDNASSGPAIFFKYLKIASKNLNRNMSTIKTHIQFRSDFLSSLTSINDQFCTNISVNKYYIIHNYYNFFYKQLSQNNEGKKLPKCKGQYLRFIGMPRSYMYEIPGMHQFYLWYLTDSSVAILTCNLIHKELYKLNKDEVTAYLDILNLEIDLFFAAGFNVALVVYSSHAIKKMIYQFLEKVLINHPFTEIHFHLEYSETENLHFNYDDFMQKLLEHFDSISGYFYLYRPFLKSMESCINTLKELRKKPFFKDIGISNYLNTVFLFYKLMKTKPFPYCKNGFITDKIRICLFNVALYDSDDENSDFTPSDFSDVDYGFGYINADDFLYFHKERVKVYIDNTIKYCDSDDIHSINQNIDNIEPSFTMEINKKTNDIVFQIDRDSSDYSFYKKKFKRKTIISSKSQKIIKNMAYVVGSFRLIEQLNSKETEFRRTQIYVAYEACKSFLRDEISSKEKAEKNNNKGIIFQVQTGEGKSFIVRLIAAVLALCGKTVHITTSNIFLANRDYHDSYEFFNNFGIKSAVLLHKEEVPTVFEEDDKNYNDNDEDENDFHYKKERFPDIYFGDDLFNNSSNMNIAVCGVGPKKHTAQVIYSTFVNFEALYLRLMEMQPKYITKYFGSSSLIIDEADSILIDELTNGTILSRPMNTNGKEILIYVYQCKMQNKPPNEVLEAIKTTWPKCTDITKKDIESMYKEIDLVNSPEFVNGKKYSIEEMEIDHTKDSKFITKIIEEVSILKGKIDDLRDKIISAPIKAIQQSYRKTFGHINKQALQKDDVSSNIDKMEKTKSLSAIEIPPYGRTDEDKKTEKIKVKYIVPFDYDHKGIIEPNKEFNGFIQQFIAIKEMFNNPEENKYIFIKDVSMSYLYASHPIFVKLYSGVCGFTGTIGDEHDKKILSKHYNLSTMEIPRHKSNRRVIMPMVLCLTIAERNRRITEEAIQFSQRGNPVLVIFQDLNEISLVYQMLRNRGLRNVNVFDGRDQKIKPDYIAGHKGAVSLGTNVCGRGTDIKMVQKPLHVIISYFTSNVRVMQQAFGRTGRRGEHGTVHVICLRDQYIKPLEMIRNDNMKDVLDDFNLKNDLQVEFIEKFKEKRGWIFDPITKTEKLDSMSIGQLRKAKINVNRIVAYNYKFPLCLSVDTFLQIQAQKIFSLFNCPNCKYTWILFQRYIREMIFESWSLFIDHAERHFNHKKHSNQSKKKYFTKKSQELFDKISEYLPDNQSSIVDTFMFIYEKIVNQWERRIYQLYKDAKYLGMKQSNTERFLSFYLGFRPYVLMDCSGSRISEVDGPKNQSFITDPELSFIRKDRKSENFISVSITEAIDTLFNKVCNVFDDLIGEFIGVKFFLRRTLGGCEFGLCFDFDLENLDDSFINDNCLIDRDPLLVFTISVRSLAPLLAGVLIFGLVYLVSISGTIMSSIAALPQTIGLKVVKKTLKTIFEQLVLNALSSQLEIFLEKIHDFLLKKLNEQIDVIKSFNSDMAIFLNTLSKIVNAKNFDKTGERITNLFNKKVHIKLKSRFAQSFITDGIPMAHLFKIGILLLLCFGAFLIGFNYEKRAIAEDKEKKNAAAFDKDHSNEKAVDQLINENADAYQEKDKIE